VALYQIPEISNFQREKVYFGGFVHGQFALLLWGPVTRQYIIVGSVWQANSTHGKKRKRKKSGQGPNIPFKGMNPFQEAPPLKCFHLQTGDVAQFSRTCLACRRPWVHPHQQENKTKIPPLCDHTMDWGSNF
jgi:hypothetical protein